MIIRVLGAGWYGCHIAASLIADGHEVQIHERTTGIFNGASGRIPARLHLGPHYPRSYATREACQRHTREFLNVYGHLTRGVPVNLYAIARHDSLVDFRQYVETLRGEFEFIEVYDPAEYGLQNVEGAILTPERHIIARLAKQHFEKLLAGRVLYGRPDEPLDDHFELTIDCTFASQGAANVDRYEPCLVLQLEGPTDRAITIMDGPFGSLYPWDPEQRLSSLSSALWTPFSKEIRTYGEAAALLNDLSPQQIFDRSHSMFDDMRRFYPALEEYRIAEPMLSIRAMPRSGADTRLVSVDRPDAGLIRVRAGKIDAVLDAERMVKELIA